MHFDPELRRHLLPLLLIFVATSVIWGFFRVPIYYHIYLLFGLIWGSFFLDLDHLIYWFYLSPNIEESRLAQLAWRKRDFLSLYKLLQSTRHRHTNLIFHHFFFQVVLMLISAFVFTSTGNVFAMSFMLALNIHLLVDEYEDLSTDRAHLQEWLFARETKQLPLAYLSRYVVVFTVLTAILTLLLVKSRL